ncbi:hypothetical protein K8I28_10520 [bacterium]|nr:hypothetical protein [bacterium]
MSLLLIRPFEVMYHGERYPVVMVRVDASGNRLYALPNKEKSDPPEPLKWVAERWIEEVLPLDQP